MGNKFPIPSKIIYICTGSKCKKRGGKDLCKAFRELAKEHNLKDEVEIIKTDCTDRCDFAPVMCLQPQNKWFHGVQEFQARPIFRQFVLEVAADQP